MYKTLMKLSIDNNNDIKVSAVIFNESNNAFKVIKHSNIEFFDNPHELVFAGVLTSSVVILNANKTGKENHMDTMSSYFSFSILRSHNYISSFPLKFNTYIIRAATIDKAASKFYTDHSNLDKSLVIAIPLGLQYDSIMDKIDYNNIVIEHSVSKEFNDGVYDIALQDHKMDDYAFDDSIKRKFFDIEDIITYICNFSVINFKYYDLDSDMLLP